MDWQSILTMVGIIAFVLLIMRGCGGMMSGGCGMGGCGMGSRRGTPANEAEERHGSRPGGLTDKR